MQIRRSYFVMTFMTLPGGWINRIDKNQLPFFRALWFVLKVKEKRGLLRASCIQPVTLSSRGKLTVTDAHLHQ